MPRDVQFLSLVQDLRSELGQSTSVAVSASNIPMLKRALRRAYNTLHAGYGWPHLHRVFDRVELAAGQRYYDMPTEVDYDRLTEVVFWYNGAPIAADRGVRLSDYALYDSNEDERADPPIRWDVRKDDTSGLPVIEVWPIPASDGGYIQFAGFTKPLTLVDDADLVDLDDDLVIMFAAASLMSPKDGMDKKKLQEAQSYLSRLRSNSATLEKPIVKRGAADEKWKPLVLSVRA